MKYVDLLSIRIIYDRRYSHNLVGFHIAEMILINGGPWITMKYVEIRYMKTSLYFNVLFVFGLN